MGFIDKTKQRLFIDGHEVSFTTESGSMPESIEKMMRPLGQVDIDVAIGHNPGRGQVIFKIGETDLRMSAKQARAMAKSLLAEADRSEVAK